MTTRKNEPRFDGYSDRINLGGRPLPQESGVLPPDFPQRLVRLKEVSGLSWSGVAQAIGVDRKQVRRWSQGVEPCGGAMLSLFRFARRIPGGMDILMGEYLPPAENPPAECEEDEEDEGDSDS